MPETRYTELYQDGVLVGTEPYVVSDEQLAKEQSDADSNDAIHQVKDNLDDWDNLSNAEKREAVKDTLTCLVNTMWDRL